MQVLVRAVNGFVLILQIFCPYYRLNELFGGIMLGSSCSFDNQTDSTFEAVSAATAHCAGRGRGTLSRCGVT
jgi:hypothetical protein